MRSFKGTFQELAQGSYCDQGDFPPESHRSRVELSYLEKTMERRQKFVKLGLQWKPLEMKHGSHFKGAPQP